MKKLNLQHLRLLRNSISDLIDVVDSNKGSRELSITKTKLEEARMWLGKEMGNVGWEDLNKKRDEKLNQKEDKSEWGTFIPSPLKNLFENLSDMIGKKEATKHIEEIAKDKELLEILEKVKESDGKIEARIIKL